MMMHAIDAGPSNAFRIPLADAIGYEDPLDPDAATDVPVVVTRRRLIRLAMIAAETAGHFGRDGVAHDPMAWMLAPRRLFGGEAAIDACLDQTSFTRALLLHGLGLGLDAEAEDIDDLVGEDGDAGVDLPAGDASPFVGEGDDRDRVEMAGPRLFTSLLVHEDGDGTTHAFDATIASDAAEARSRLAARRGAGLAEVAEIREGFDARLPLVEALVSPAVADMLLQVADAPGSPLARGLEVSIEQRFAA